MKNIKEQVMEVLIKQKAFILEGGPFFSSGGLKVPFFVDIRRLSSDPKTLKLIARYFAEIVKENECDYIAGMETAGIPYATAISLEADVPFFYIRKKPQDHGLKSTIATLPPKEDAKIALVDDAVGGGGAITLFLENLKKEDYNNVKLFLYIVEADIMQKAEKRIDELKNQGVTCHYIITWKEWVDYMLKNNQISEKLAQYCYEFIENPLSFANEEKLSRYCKDKENGLLWIREK